MNTTECKAVNNKIYVTIILYYFNFSPFFLFDGKEEKKNKK